MDAQERRARREESRRRLRRRRLAALAALLGTVVVVAAIVALGAGGSSHRSPPAAQPMARKTRRSLAQASRAPGRDPVPILMYHVIAAPPAGAPFPGLYVPPGEFAEQMQALKDAGWHAVTPDQVEAYWRRGVPLGPGKPIVLSFDNGYQSQYTEAFPTLRRLGWVGEENVQLTGLPPSQGGIGQQELRALVAAGWELDTQGFSHADLIALDPERLHHEVSESRRLLRRRFHVPVDWFCYPSGHYDARVIAEVRAAGYVGSTTVVPGWAHRDEDPYRMHRLRVLGGTTGAQLLSLLEAVRDDPPAPASYSGA